VRFTRVRPTGYEPGGNFLAHKHSFFGARWLPGGSRARVTRPALPSTGQPVLRARAQSCAIPDEVPRDHGQRAVAPNPTLRRGSLK